MADFTGKKALIIASRVIAVLWAIWVLLDYLVHHSYLTASLSSPPYGGLLAVLTIGAAGLGYWSWRKIRHSKTADYKLHYRGWWLFLMVQVLALVILAAFGNSSYLPPGSMAVRMGYFFFYSSFCFAGLFLLVTLWHTLGQWLTVGFSSWQAGNHKLINIALGSSIFGTLLAVFGQFGGISIFLLWPLVVAILALGWRNSLEFVRSTVWERKAITWTKAWTLPLFLLLLSIVAINWLAAFKPFPIGYDGAGLYANLARLVAASGTLPEGGQAFNWSVMMGAAQVLFQQPVFAMFLSHSMNLLLLFLLYRLGRKFFSADYSLLAASLTFLAPYFAFHGIVDEKTDLAFTFILLSALLLLLEVFGEKWNQANADTEVSLFAGRFSLRTSTWVCLLTGWLMGYGFGIKYTAVMFGFALLSWLGYRLKGKLGFAMMLFLSLGVLFVGRVYRFGYLSIEPLPAITLGGVLLLLSGVAAFLAYRKDWQQIMVPARMLSFLALGFLLAFMPWGIKHLSEHQSIGVNQLLEGKSPTPTIDLQDYRIYGYDPEAKKRDYWSDIQEIIPDWVVTATNPYASFTKLAQQNANDELTEDSGFKEEIQRYLGYEPAFWRYFSLPYDLMTNTNIPNSRYLDIGFLGLLFFPLLLLGNRPRRWLWTLPVFLGGLLVYVALVQLSVGYVDGQGFDAVSFHAQLIQQYGTTSDGSSTAFWGLYSGLLSVFTGIATSLVPLYEIGISANVFATIVVMLLLAVALFFGWKNAMRSTPKIFKAFAAFCFTYGLFWWIMGNGIIWYAMPLFVVLPLLVTYFLVHSSAFLGEESASFSRYYLGGATTVTILFFTALYFSSPFPTDNANAALFRWPFIEYASNGNYTEDKALQAFNPVLPDLKRLVNADLEGKVYQVNTFYGYLIEDNLSRVYEDPTLSKYQEVVSKLNQPEEFFDVLKSKGFKYILFDLKTALNDRTNDQSLRQKFGSIARILTNSSKVKLLLTDNIIADPSAPVVRLKDGSSGNGRYGLDGQTVQLGNLALFEIP